MDDQNTSSVRLRVHWGIARAVGVVATALAVSCPVQANPAVALKYRAPEMTSPVRVDGRLDEWQGVEKIRLVGESWWQAAREGQKYGGPGDLAARFGVGWDRDNLYLAIEAYDNDLVPPTDPMRMLDGDCVVVAFDARNDAGQGYGDDDSELGFAYTPGGPFAWRWFPTPRAGPVFAAKVAVVREVKPGPLEAGIPPIKLTYEIALPWSELLGKHWARGDALGFDLAINDVDAGCRHGWIAWTPGIMSIKDPSAFADVVLVGPLTRTPGGAEPAR